MLMECREARRLMHAQLDNDTNPLEEQALERHVSTCAACAETQRALQSTVDCLSLLARARAPHDFTAKVMSQVQPTGRKRAGQHWTRLLATAAMLAILVGSPIYYTWITAFPQVILDDPSARITLQGGQAKIAAGQVISGDITIYKAHLIIAGEVRGNVQVIAGSVQIEDGGQVHGSVTEAPANMSGKLKLAMAELWDDIRHLFMRR